MNDEQIQKTQKDMTGAVLRAARELRNKTQNLVLLEDAGEDARWAWKELDRALKTRDDFMVDLLADVASRSA